MGNCSSCFQGISLEQLLINQGVGRPNIQQQQLNANVYNGYPPPRLVQHLHREGDDSSGKTKSSSRDSSPVKTNTANNYSPSKNGSRSKSIDFATPTSGRTKALLVGINYVGTSAELRGCHNDVKNVKQLLTETYAWSSSTIRSLTDNYDSSPPTRRNILDGIDWLIQDARKGDVLFFLYSGHGSQEQDNEGLEEDGMCDTILPSDFQETGMLSDDELTRLMVSNLPEGVSLTAVIDACHSGTALNLPWCWTYSYRNMSVRADSNIANCRSTHAILSEPPAWREAVNPFFSRGDVQMFSGCTDDQTSSDGGRDLYNRPGGALTTAFCEVLRSRRQKISYSDLLSELLDSMSRNGFSQTPQLSSSQPFDATATGNKPFTLAVSSSGPPSGIARETMKICRQINPATPKEFGQVFRRKFPPRPRPLIGSPIEELLGDLGFLAFELFMDEAVFGGACEGIGGGVTELMGGGFGEGGFGEGGFGLVNGLLDVAEDVGTGFMDVGNDVVDDIEDMF